MLLWCEAQERGYDDNQWLTYKQALEHGGQVRKGEKGSRIVFVSFLDKTNGKTGALERVPFLRDYVVFNVAQCECLKRALGADPTYADAMFNGVVAALSRA